MAEEVLKAREYAGRNGFVGSHCAVLRGACCALILQV
jgi:hypothetical protein